MTANQASDFINRLVVLVAGMIIAFCLLWAGSEMHEWVAQTMQTPKGCPDHSLNCSINFWPAFIVCTLCSGTISGSLFVLVRTMLQVKAGNRFNDIGSVFEMIAGVICTLFTFGVIVAPLQAKGTWLSPFDFLLVLSAAQAFIVAKDIFIGLFETEVKVERSTNERTPLRKVA